jgi:hypothetical protein
MRSGTEKTQINVDGTVSLPVTKIGYVNVGPLLCAINRHEKLCIGTNCSNPHFGGVVATLIHRNGILQIFTWHKPAYVETAASICGYLNIDIVATVLTAGITGTGIEVTNLNPV